MKKLVCRLLGHKYRLLRKVCPGVRELRCSRCKQEVAMNDMVGSVLPLDQEFIRMHNEMIDLQNAMAALAATLPTA